ncbi:hypothetical protein PIB30_037259 [Stylosanthes scabra]|uniref:Uncharacterized protein n=1 Tax=Stylosanthes scabra TaxID=79078 RepID=A0ABU6TEC9_9FABA|nr:hypothetical protein [Stylosanthes scabra]
MQIHSQQARVMDATCQSSPLETTRLGNRSKEFKSFHLLKHVSKIASTIKTVPFCKRTSIFHFHKKNQMRETHFSTHHFETELINPGRTSNHISSPDKHQSRTLHFETEKEEAQTNSKTHSRRSKTVKAELEKFMEKIVSNILLSPENSMRMDVVTEVNEIRLIKPGAALRSPFTQLDSTDLKTN